MHAPALMGARAHIYTRVHMLPPPPHTQRAEPQEVQEQAFKDHSATLLEMSDEHIQHPCTHAFRH